MQFGILLTGNNDWQIINQNVNGVWGVTDMSVGDRILGGLYNNYEDAVKELEVCRNLTAGSRILSYMK